MIEEILAELKRPEGIAALTSDICIPEFTDITLNAAPLAKEDIFKAQAHKSWDKSVEARCDFKYIPRMTKRAGVFFSTIWQKSVFGRTLTDIKSDDDMVAYFADSMVPFIGECLGSNLGSGSWAIVTTPMRRHKEHNFASLIAEGIAERMRIPFYFDCAHCHSKHRVGAVFTANNIPSEPNVIVFDDFVTTGSTLLSMKNLLLQHNKNLSFFAGINNKL